MPNCVITAITYAIYGNSEATTGSCGSFALISAATGSCPYSMVTNATTTCVGRSSCKVPAFVNGICTTSANTLSMQATINILGDNGPATNAGLFKPSGVAFKNGNLYIADTNNHRVRMVDAAATGIIRTIAGTGTNTATTIIDVGMAGTSMQLSYPAAVAVDASGNVYVADTYHHRIRLWNAVTGMIATRVGSGTGASIGGDFGPATSAVLNYPSGVALDNNGVLYIADTNNCRIRRVDPSGIITTVAGYNGAVTTVLPCGATGDTLTATSALLNSPKGVFFDKFNNMYIADSGNNKIRKVKNYCYSGCSNIIKTFAGTGVASFTDGMAATSATLNNPTSVVVDSSGNVVIADTNNHRIRKVFNATGTIGTFAGAGTAGYDGDYVLGAGMSKINAPLGMCIDSWDVVYVADSGNNVIRKIVFALSRPTSQPTTEPTNQPTVQPSCVPTLQPSMQPSRQPTNRPTMQPSRQPTNHPTIQPTQLPSSRPSRQPTVQPSCLPTLQPSMQPSRQPTNRPTMQPSRQPSNQPTMQPSLLPTSRPSRQPTQQPTQHPSQQPSGHNSSLVRFLIPYSNIYSVLTLLPYLTLSCHYSCNNNPKVNHPNNPHVNLPLNLHNNLLANQRDNQADNLVHNLPEDPLDNRPNNRREDQLHIHQRIHHDNQHSSQPCNRRVSP